MSFPPRVLPLACLPAWLPLDAPRPATSRPDCLIYRLTFTFGESGCGSERAGVSGPDEKREMKGVCTHWRMARDVSSLCGRMRWCAFFVGWRKSMIIEQVRSCIWSAFVSENWTLLSMFIAFVLSHPFLSPSFQKHPVPPVAGRRRRFPRRNFFEPARQLLAKGRPLTSLPPHLLLLLPHLLGFLIPLPPSPRPPSSSSSSPWQTCRRGKNRREKRENKSDGGDSNGRDPEAR